MFFEHLTIYPGMEHAKPFQVNSPNKIKTTIRLRKRSMAKSALLFLCIVMAQLALPHPVAGDEQLRVGVYDNYPMQFVGNDGKVEGILIDILEYISSREKWKIHYVPGSLTDGLERLAREEIDLLVGIEYSRERNKIFDFTYENISSDWAVVYTQKKSDINQIVNLDNKKIAVVHNDIHYNNLRKLAEQFKLNCRFIEAYEYDAVLELVADKRADAGVVERLYGLEFEKLYEVSRSHIIFSPADIHFAVPKKKHGELIRVIDRYLAHLKADKKSFYHESLARWTPKAGQWELPKWFVPLLTLAGGLIVLFLGAGLVLREQVKAKTAELSLINEELRAEIAERQRAERERERIQAQFRQAQKMEAVGTLAGGIAHDFNNLLQAVQGYAQLLQLKKGKEESGQREISQIIRAAERGADLTRKLLTFSRKVESELRPIELNYEVESVRLLLERTIPKMIQMEFHLAEDLNIVNADPGQVEQILMNLAVNSKDAMPEGGRFTVETANVSLDENYCMMHPQVRPGEYVQLTVSDNGHGMSGETLEHIFEPFYTTKETGKGTGLGLATVYGIVKCHNGHITCYSELDEGTTFKIYFPAVKSRDKIIRPQAEPVALRGGTEIILLVDDEEAIRFLGTEILEEVGYTVLTATDGESALQLYREKHPRISLVILDLIMPGMGGKRCLVELLEVDPEARVVIASGYSPDGPTREILKNGAKGFVSKPYDLRQMLNVVRQVLDQD